MISCQDESPVFLPGGWGADGGLLAQFVVFRVAHRFEPLVGAVLAGYLESKVGKPTVGSCAVPVLHVGRNVDDVAGFPSS